MTLAVLALLAANLGAAPEPPLVWPLDLPRALSSSFAEYRPGRFHAGIDLRTQGTGRDVRAAGDGYISRVRCAPGGYGRAVYLQMDNGLTAVYAHLQDYDEAVTAYVRAAQHAKESYTVDLYPEPNQFRITAGQVIARSGQTGIGAPHLHYELRDRNQQPVAPRNCGVDWPDTMPPKLTRVLIAPNGHDGRVDGDLVPVTRALEYLGDGRYRCAPVRVAGEVGFGIDFYDQAEGGLQLGAHRLELAAGGETRFEVRHDALSYTNHYNAVVSYHPFFTSEGRFLLLWRWPGNVCASYAHSPGTGWLDTTGLDEATLRVSDSAGNTATLTIPLLPTDPPETLFAGEALQGDIDVQCLGTDLVFGVRFDGPESNAPVLLARHGDAPAERLPFARTDSERFRARWIPEQPGAYRFTVDHPRVKPFEERFHVFLRGAAGNGSASNVAVAVPADAPYGALFFQAAQLTDYHAALEKTGPAYRVGPVDSPIDATVELSFPVPGGYRDEPRLRVYRRSGDSWSVQSTSVGGGRASVRTRRFGDFALLVDREAPMLSDVLPAEGYQAQTRRPYIRATVRDTGSGISRVEARCGGDWLLCAYDPERNRMEWMRDEELPPGEQTITLRAWDEVGNVQTVTRTVIVPD